MRTFTLLISIAILTIVSCKSEAEKTHDALGWSQQYISQLKKECKERYDKEHPHHEIDRDAYCDCIVDKISMSVTHEDHINADEVSLKSELEFSETCEALTGAHKDGTEGH